MKKLLFYFSKIGILIFLVLVILVFSNIGLELIQVSKLVKLSDILETLVYFFILVIVIIIAGILIYHTVKETYNE